MPKTTKPVLTRWGLALVALGSAWALAMAIAATHAAAISSDYCGQVLGSGTQCYEGSGYRPWRYHQASTYVQVPALCAQSYTGSNYRTGSGCGGNTDFYSFCNFYATPNANSSVNWSGSGGSYTVNGHADDSRSHSRISSNNGC